MSKRANGEGCIYQRKNKQGKFIGYVAQITVGSNGRDRKTFSGKTRADVAAKLQEAQESKKLHRLTMGAPQTVEQFLGAYLADRRLTLRPRTLEVYELNARRLCQHLGQIKLEALQAAHVQQCYAALQKKGLMPRTILQAHRLLHAALKEARLLRVIHENVTELVRPPRPTRQEMTTYSADQVGVLFESTRGDRFAALWVLLATTGLRLGEALGLKWGDVDFERGGLVVQRALQRQTGVGLVFVEPKSAGSRRRVELGSLTIATLREHRAGQNEERLRAGSDWQRNDLVFCTCFGSPLDRDRIQRHWENAREKSDLPRIRLHDLRHTHASLLLAQDEHPKVVQERLGHSSISITLDLYSHVAPTMQRHAADRLDALLQAAAGG